MIPSKGTIIKVPKNEIAYIKKSTDQRVEYEIHVDGDSYLCTEFSVNGTAYIDKDIIKAVGDITIQKTIKTAK